jgi:2,4-dienoyl-CoA reductase (NADPH2)
MKQEVSIPLVTSNRINLPASAEDILARGDADIVSLARPMLADPEFGKKAREGRADEINVCIACNQACLDHTFANKMSSCLVNPRACHETELNYERATTTRRFAVIGAGPAGLSAALVLAERGHAVDLYDAAAEIGGQLNMAKVVPGKEEFHEMLRYFGRQVELSNINLQLETRVSANDLTDKGYDGVIIATGVVPRDPRMSIWCMTRATLPLSTSMSGWPNGVLSTLPRSAAAWHVIERPRHHRRERSHYCSAIRASSARNWARPRAGSIGRRSR